jgi:hypothetical protein
MWVQQREKVSIMTEAQKQYEIERVRVIDSLIEAQGDALSCGDHEHATVLQEEIDYILLGGSFSRWY